MIKIKPILNNGVIDGPERKLTIQEKATVTSLAFDGVDYVYYQGDEPIKEPEPIVLLPNWLGLEQDLRYSSVFGRRKEVDPIDFNIFTTTLVNGKLGHASENALAFGFSILGLTWSQPEIDLINSLLHEHNFVFRLENSGARMFTRSVVGEALEQEAVSVLVPNVGKNKKSINWQLIEKIAIYLSITALIIERCLSGLK